MRRAISPGMRLSHGRPGIMMTECNSEGVGSTAAAGILQRTRGSYFVNQRFICILMDILNSTVCGRRAINTVRLPPDHLPEEDAKIIPLNEDAALQALEDEYDGSLGSLDKGQSSLFPPDFNSKSTSSRAQFIHSTFAAQHLIGIEGHESGHHRIEFRAGRHHCILEAGYLARTASGAVSIRVGNTTVLATVTSKPRYSPRKEASIPSLPFRVDYREKLYAVGRIPVTYNKREGAPKDHETLASRRMERALRTLFPRGFVYETDVTASVLSADGSFDPEVAALNASSAALMLSHIPWHGPLGAVRVTISGEKIFINQSPFWVSSDEVDGNSGFGRSHHRAGIYHQTDEDKINIGKRSDASTLRSAATSKAENRVPSKRDIDASILIAVTEKSFVLLEVEVKDPIPELLMNKALKRGFSAAQDIIKAQKELAKCAKNKKKVINLAGADPAANLRVVNRATEAVSTILHKNDLSLVDRVEEISSAKMALIEEMKRIGAWRAEFARIPGSGCVSAADIDHTFSATLSSEWRKMIFNENTRPDGRGLIDTRPSNVILNHLPVVHGSSVFELGETQVLSTLTVGVKSEQQRIESLLGGESSKRMFVHYNLPEFAVPHPQQDPGIGGSNGFGPISSVGGVLRHEIDRSSFVEKALYPVLPPLKDYPFTFRLNTELLVDDGGGVGAAINGCSIALAAAGVALKSLVAGVCVGLASEVGTWSGENSASSSAIIQNDEPAHQSKPMTLGRVEFVTDPTALETMLGDMELRIAGTKEGITAMQLESLIPGGIPMNDLFRAIEQGKVARLRVLNSMESTVAQKRHSKLPSFGVVKISPSSIGRVIGREGSNLRTIESRTGARIQIEDNGTLSIFAPTASQLTSAKQTLLKISGDGLEIGREYRGRVQSIKDFGIYIKIPDCDTHVLMLMTELDKSDGRPLEEMPKPGQEIDIIFKGKDSRGALLVGRKETYQHVEP